MSEHGVLLSHAPDGDVHGPFHTREQAEAARDLVLAAQPGIEAVIVTRADGDYWRDESGRTVRQIIEARWT